MVTGTIQALILLLMVTNGVCPLTNLKKEPVYNDFY